MHHLLLPLLSYPLLLSSGLQCQPAHTQKAGTVTATVATQAVIPDKVSQLSPPAGYTRLAASPGSFAAWLRNITLKKDPTVYLYNKQPKPNQTAQYAVLDIPVGDKDLQQCADAVIRLRATYLYQQGQTAEIAFSATDGTRIDYPSWQEGYRFKLLNNKLIKVKNGIAGNSSASFDLYLQTVFAYAGTLSLSRELKPVAHIHNIEPGNVFIKGGSPGHAVIVMDVATNAAGQKMFLLAQSYMPAQDIHILQNPVDKTLSPWYPEDFGQTLLTPEWRFEKGELMKF